MAKDRRRSLPPEKHFRTRALLGVKDCARLTASEPDVLRIIGDESEAKGTDKLSSQQIDRIVKDTRAKQAKRR